MPHRGQSIVLIGFMGSGKSSAGLALAQRTGWPLLDTDEMVSARFGLSIPEIFAAFGEIAFRETEAKALRELSMATPGIIVTGGGIVLRPENVAILRKLGKVVCLEADAETLFQRISQGRPRPLLQTQDPHATLLELLRVRDPLYREAADIRVETSHLGPAEVAEAVLKGIEALCVRPLH